MFDRSVTHCNRLKKYSLNFGDEFSFVVLIIIAWGTSVLPCPVVNMVKFHLHSLLSVRQTPRCMYLCKQD